MLPFVEYLFSNKGLTIILLLMSFSKFDRSKTLLMLLLTYSLVCHNPCIMMLSGKCSFSFSVLVAFVKVLIAWLVTLFLERPSSILKFCILYSSLNSVTMVLAFLKSSCLSSGELESSYLDVLLLVNKIIPAKHKVLTLGF